MDPLFKPMSDTHAAKEPKTTSTGPTLYSELDIATSC